MRTRAHSHGQGNKSVPSSTEDEGGRRKDQPGSIAIGSRSFSATISDDKVNETEKLVETTLSLMSDDRHGDVNDTLMKQDNKEANENAYTPITSIQQTVPVHTNDGKTDDFSFKCCGKILEKSSTLTDKEPLGTEVKLVTDSTDVMCNCSSSISGEEIEKYAIDEPQNSCDNVLHIPRKRLRSEMGEEELWDGLQSSARSKKIARKQDGEIHKKQNSPSFKLSESDIPKTEKNVLSTVSYSPESKCTPKKFQQKSEEIADQKLSEKLVTGMSGNGNQDLFEKDGNKVPFDNSHPHKKHFRSLRVNQSQPNSAEKSYKMSTKNRELTPSRKSCDTKKSSPFRVNKVPKSNNDPQRSIPSIVEVAQSVNQSSLQCKKVTKSGNSSISEYKRISRSLKPATSISDREKNTSLPSVCSELSSPIKVTIAEHDIEIKSNNFDSQLCDGSIQCDTSSSHLNDKTTEYIIPHSSEATNEKKSDGIFNKLEPGTSKKYNKHMSSFVETKDALEAKVSSVILSEFKDSVTPFKNKSSEEKPFSPVDDDKILSTPNTDTAAKHIITNQSAGERCQNAESPDQQTKSSPVCKTPVIEEVVCSPDHQICNTSNSVKKSHAKRNLFNYDIPTTPKRSERIQNKKTSTPTNKNVDCFIYPSLKKLDCHKLENLQTVPQSETPHKDLSVEKSNSSETPNKNLPLKKRLIEDSSVKEVPHAKIPDLESAIQADFFQRAGQKFNTTKQNKAQLLSTRKHSAISILKCNEKVKELNMVGLSPSKKDKMKQNDTLNIGNVSAVNVNPVENKEIKKTIDNDVANTSPSSVQNPDSSFTSEQIQHSSTLVDTKIQNDDNKEMALNVQKDSVDEQNPNETKKENENIKSNKAKRSSQSNESAENPKKKTKANPKPARRRTVDKALPLHSTRRGYDAERFDKLVNDPILDKHACVLWSSEHRRHFQQSHPDADQCEIDDLMRKAWEILEKKDKVRYFQRAQAALRDENKHSYVRKSRKTDKKAKVVAEEEEEDGITLDISQTNSSETFLRAVRKFMQLSSHDQDVKLRKTMNLFRQLLPQNIIFKLTTELKKVIKAYMKDQVNKGLSKKDLNSGCRKILFEKLEIMKPKILESQGKEQSKRPEDVATEFNRKLRQLIAGESVHFSERAKVESLTPTLLDLKELESCGKLNVSGVVQPSPSYETLLEDLKKPREYSRPIIDKSVKFLRFKSPIQDNTNIQDIDLSRVNSSILDNILGEVAGQEMPIIEVNTVDKFFVDNSCQMLFSQPTKEINKINKISDNIMRMMKSENQHRPDNGATVDEYIGRHFHDRATRSYNRFVGHGPNCCHEHTSPACVLTDCVVSERYFSMARQSRTQSRRSACAPRRNEFSASNEIYIRLNGPGSLENKLKEETKSKDTPCEK